MFKGGGVQIEILKNPGIYFYSGLRTNVQGELQFEILNIMGGGGVQYDILKSVHPLISKPGSATVSPNEQ